MTRQGLGSKIRKKIDKESSKLEKEKKQLRAGQGSRPKKGKMKL